MAMFSGMMRGMGNAAGGMMGGGGGGGMRNMMRPQNRPMPQQGGAIGGSMGPPSMGGGTIRQGSQVGNMMQNVVGRGNRGIGPTLGPPVPSQPRAAPAPVPPQMAPPIQPQSPNGGAAYPPQMYTPSRGGMDPTPGGANVTDMLPQQPPQDAMDMINRMKQPPQMGPFGGPQRFPGGGRGNFWDMQNRGGGGGIAPSWLQNMRSQGGM